MSQELKEDKVTYISAPDEKWGSLFYCSETFMSAKLAADACATAVDKVLDKESHMNKGYCIVRPPGHHAHPD